MAFIAFASAKGSPGVTTAVAALAATWPAGRDLLLVEADPSGGDLVVRFDLSTEPGLVSLAAAGRRELSSGTLLDHTQQLPQLSADVGAQRRLLAAPVAADQSGAALSSLRGSLSRTLDLVDIDVLVDCGRIDPGSPALELATEADLLVMVARPVVAEVHHLASRLGSITHPALSLLMVGEHPYPVSEVATAVGASPLGTLAADARAATVLSDGHPNVGRVLRRSRLLRDARALAEGLAAWLGTGAGTGAAATQDDAGTAAPGPAEGRETAGSPASAPGAPGAQPPPLPVAPGARQSSPPVTPGARPSSPPVVPGARPSSPPVAGTSTEMPLSAPTAPSRRLTAPSPTAPPPAPAPGGPGRGPAPAAPGAPAPATAPAPPLPPPPPSPPATPARGLAAVGAPDAGGDRPPLPPPPRFSPLPGPAEPDGPAAPASAPGGRPPDTPPKHLRRRGAEERGR